MGALFSEHVVGVRSPRVALLSLGEERGKGDTRVKEATELISATDLNFVGNVEGKDLTADMADVVVCDAMLGNVVIKFFEGLSGFIFDHCASESGGTCEVGSRTCSRPGIARIRKTFDYEIVGGSPLLGVKGAVIITHGRAKRRMIEHAVRVGATTARERVPELIAEALAADAAAEAGRAAVGRRRRRARPRAGRLLMPGLSVGTGVIRDTVRLATLEVPGVLRVGRGGPAWRDALGGNPVHVRVRDGRVHVTVWLVARPRQRLVPLTAQVRAAIAAAVERLLGMELGGVTVLVDGTGA